MKLLFLDTETTGFWRKELALNDDEQPHVVEFAGILSDLDGTEHATVDLIVSPKGWEIPKDASDIHGITQERAEKFGVSSRLMLSCANHMAATATIVICHNVDYDIPVIRSEIARADVSDVFATTPTFCTMKALEPVLKIPSKYEWAKGYKWPTLTECHEHYFGEPFENAHNGLADVRATMKIFFEALRRGDIAFPKD